MRILMFGATGMVGQGVLHECLRDKRVSDVVSVVRSSSGTKDPKRSEIVLPDLFGIEQVADRLGDFDACFFCLGVSSLGLSERDYTRVTYNLTMIVAEALAPLNPRMTFVYVTGAGTDRGSRQMWARVKARTEDALAALPFKASFFFRPGFIQPMHGVVSKTRWIMAVYGAVAPFAPALVRRFPHLATTTERVGRAMIHVADQGYGSAVLDSAAINAAGAGA